MKDPLYPGGMSGCRGDYQWLMDDRRYTGHLVRLCPDIFIGRCLCVTAIDSGAPFLKDYQREAGWEIRAGIAYSPRISAEKELFYQRDGSDRAGFDEWYLFERDSVDLGTFFEGNPYGGEHGPGQVVKFVGFPHFTLDRAEPTTTEMFWQQVEWMQPDAYIGDGETHLTFVSRNEALFDSVYRRLSRDNVERIKMGDRRRGFMADLE